MPGHKTRTQKRNVLIDRRLARTEQQRTDLDHPGYHRRRDRRRDVDVDALANLHLRFCWRQSCAVRHSAAARGPQLESLQGRSSADAPRFVPNVWLSGRYCRSAHGAIRARGARGSLGCRRPITGRLSARRLALFRKSHVALETARELRRRRRAESGCRADAD